MPVLKEIVVKDAVELPVGKKLLKADYISAIILFRHPPEDELNDDEGSDTEEQPVPPAHPNTVVESEETEEQPVPPAHPNSVDESEKMAMSKKFLSVNTISELQAIARKEKVVLGPGRKTKIHYIDAIYLGRQSK